MTAGLWMHSRCPLERYCLHGDPAVPQDQQDESGEHTGDGSCEEVIQRRYDQLESFTISTGS